MARTHGASGRFHMDDGVLVDKHGIPMPTTPLRGIPAAAMPPAKRADDPPLPPAPVAPEAVAPTEYAFLCDKTTWQRNMDGYEALHLLNVMLGDLSATVTPEQLSKLPASIDRQ